MHYNGWVRSSVYVHFPYCLKKCPYCDFVSYKADRAEIDHAGYADAVIAELGRRMAGEGPRTADGGPIGSIFFGGGTPSLWEPREIARVLDAARRTLVLADDVEITVECNPTSLDRDRAAALLAAGVNRLSIGAQSLRDGELAFLGRLHDPAGALRAIEGALATGVRVSADLIYGLPDQSPEDAARQADQLAALGLAHVSAYQLTIEEGTLFGELRRRGRLPMADDARVAEAFVLVEEALASRGLAHYEISNFARPGEEARHNLGYWRGEPYLGVGCGAYGFQRIGPGGRRWRNELDPARYMHTARSGADTTISSEDLDGDALLRERIMLGLRLAGGLDLDEAGRDLALDPWPARRVKAADALAARGRLVRDGGQVRIPHDAWLFTDDTASRLF